MSFEMRKLTSFPMQKLCYDLELQVLEQMKPEDVIELVKVYGRQAMSFEMRKLTSFPMQKLCYDLELEVLEQMKPEDTMELVKVNAGFRSILLRAPWLVFGRHVHRIFSRDDWISINHRPHDSTLTLNVALRFPLFKRIHSCDLFETGFDEPFCDLIAPILNHLKSVKHLELSVRTNEDLLKFLENFRSVIGKSADINVDIDLFEENQVISEHFENFIANQMNDCEKVCFHWTSAAAFHFYYAAFAKTSIEFLEIRGKSLADDGFEKVVESIVEKGIPSKNLKSAIYLNDDDSQERDCRIVDFLSRFPGMKRLEGGNQQKVIKIAKEIWDKHLDYDFEFSEKSVIFRRNIDSKRDCVYMLGSCTYEDDIHSGTGTGTGTEFFAFYIHPESGKIEF